MMFPQVKRHKPLFVFRITILHENALFAGLNQAWNIIIQCKFSACAHVMCVLSAQMMASAMIAGISLDCQKRFLMISWV